MVKKKATHQTDRNSIERFDQIINIGSAMTDDFCRLGFVTPQDLAGKDPLKLYKRICSVSGQFHDPCVLDTYMATIDYMNGGRPKAWWKYTADRKKLYGQDVDLLRKQFASP